MNDTGTLTISDGLKAAPSSQAERWARAAVEKIVEGDLVVASLLELVGEAIEHGWLATASVESVAHVESVICRAKTWQNTR